MSTSAPAIRLAPIPFTELPDHPSFPGSLGHPDLLSFTLTLLDQGRALLAPQDFNLTFKHHSRKASQPSNNDVEILSHTVSEASLQQLPWNSATIPRSKPTTLSAETWYARRSVHSNHSAHHAPGTASWEEFIYGLRDEHSRHEFDFTPTIIDARLICEWNEALNRALNGTAYSNATMAIYEMVHEMPGPLAPRCFPVLVITASVSEQEFVAVTVPVDVMLFGEAFYSTGRNRREGKGKRAKSVVLGEYCAVERIVRYAKQVAHEGHSHGDEGEEIEWVMAAASDAKHIPMVFQRMGVPGAIAKDVGLFLKWIRTVKSEDIAGQKVGTSTAPG